MERQIITFSANEQQLIKTGGIDCYASNIVRYIEAHFELGDNWQGFDSVRAVWFTDFKKIATVLDSLGNCIVPFEVLVSKAEVKVNLVGSISENDVLTDRGTTFPIVALKVTANARVDGDNTQPITPSQFEQFAAAVRTDRDRAETAAESAETSAGQAAQSAANAGNSEHYADMSAAAAEDSANRASRSEQNARTSAIEAEGSAMRAAEEAGKAEQAKNKILSMRATADTLPAGSDATASYSDGLLTLGIPRGDKGEKGDRGVQGETGATPNITIGTVETLEPTEDASVTITGTAENPVLNFGIPQGRTGEVSNADLKSLLPRETVSGNPVTITDGQPVVPAKSLQVTLVPIQSGSGTPSPDNVRLISGRTEVVTQRTGVNVWDEEWESGDYTDADGQPHVQSSRIRTKNPIPVLPSTSYYFSLPGRGQLFYYDANDNFISTTNWLNSSAFVTPNNCRYLRFYILSTTTYNNDISINYPSTDHDYHAYQGETYTTALGQTVYGGTLDVVSGELVVDRAMVDLGALTYTKSSYISNGFVAINGMPDDFPVAPSASKVPNWLSSIYVPYSNVGIEAQDVDGAIAWRVSGSSKGVIIRDSRYAQYYADNDMASFKEAMQGVQLCYELATPQTIQLTAEQVKLLQGNNVVWTDGNQLSMTYSADVALWIQKQLS